MRKRTTVSLDEATIQAAKRHNINVSKAAREGVIRAIKDKTDFEDYIRELLT